MRPTKTRKNGQVPVAQLLKRPHPRQIPAEIFGQRNAYTNGSKMGGVTPTPTAKF